MPVVRLTGAQRAPEELIPEPARDVTYGHTRDQLLQRRAPEKEPADLDAFWAGIARETAAIDPDPQLGPWRRFDGSETGGLDPAEYEVADLTFRSLDGLMIGGWVVRPVAGADEIAVVTHGYGGRSEPALPAVMPSALSVQPVARGLPTRSTVPGIDAEHLHHVLWGIENPRSYSHIGSTADFWLAETVAHSLLPGARRSLYQGGSFGGGIGAFALGYSDRFDAAVLEVPSFGDQPWRIGVDSVGSSGYVHHYAGEHPEVLATLRYADAASAARRIHVPTYVTAALADPFVPPPGQFAVAMSIAGPTWVYTQPAGHAEWPGQEHEQRPTPREIRAFLDDPRA